MQAHLPLEQCAVSSRRWAALRIRDPSANSTFLYGVISTKIFCRPTCPARLARRSNIVYFDDIPAAREAGYRACKRCDPCNASWHREMRSRADFVQAQKLIAEAELQGENWTVAKIAEQVGVSIGHLHRLFKKYANTTPREFSNNRVITKAPVYYQQGEIQSESVEGLSTPAIQTQRLISDSTHDLLLWSPWDNLDGGFEQVLTAQISNMTDLDDLWKRLPSEEPLMQPDGQPLVNGSFEWVLDHEYITSSNQLLETTEHATLLTSEQQLS